MTCWREGHENRLPKILMATESGEEGTMTALLEEFDEDAQARITAVCNRFGAMAATMPQLLEFLVAFVDMHLQIFNGASAWKENFAKLSSPPGFLAVLLERLEKPKDRAMPSTENRAMPSTASTP